MCIYPSDLTEWGFMESTPSQNCLKELPGLTELQAHKFLSSQTDILLAYPLSRKLLEADKLHLLLQVKHLKIFIASDLSRGSKT